ncbi:PEGA domain-containing protein [Lujinxingia sediminis]|nr:PEGA domain-containing protein [Lujinxingia sediminis]
MKMRVCGAVLAAMVVWLCSATAFAADPDQIFDELSEAEKVELIELIDAGSAAYDDGLFQQAADSFHQAYELVPLPDFLYRLGLAYERLGEDARAVEYYRSFLNQVPQAEERGRIESTIEVIERRLAARAKTAVEVITRPEGARVYVDSKESGMRGVTPIDLNVEAGSYTLFIELEGYESVEERVQVPEGQTVVLRLGLEPEGVVGPAESSFMRSAWVPASLAVAGVGALALMPVFRSQAEAAGRESEEIRQRPEGRTAANNAAKEAADRREATYNGLAIASPIIGALALTSAGAILMWQLLSDDPAEERGVSAMGVGPMGEDGMGVGIQGRF